MGYGDYKLNIVLRTFGLTIHQANLFAEVFPIEPSAWLRELLNRAHSIALFSEKSRCEYIVAPILLACQEILAGQCCVYSGIRLDVDAERGLKGECDFLLGQAPPAPVLQAPLLVVVEAKKNDIEEGIGQCAAQMVAVRMYNEQEQHPVPLVHGCVTTGEAWQFIRMEETVLTVDAERYYIREVNKILGILVSLMRKA
jgi:hypothetical protein